MPAPIAMYNGVDEIMTAFDMIGGDDPCYTFWYSSTDMAFQACGDPGENRRILQETLQAAAQNNNPTVFRIKFHPRPKKGEYLDKKPVMLACLYVCAVEPDSQVPPGGGTVAVAGRMAGYPEYERLFTALQSLDGIEGKISTLIDSKLAAMGSAAVESELPEIDPIEKYLVYLQHPVIAGIVNKFADKLLPVITNLFSQDNTQPAPSLRVAGRQPVQTSETVNEPATESVPGFDANVLDSALDRLIKHCNIDTDLSLLADLADNNPDMFKMLLMQLRSQTK